MKGCKRSSDWSDGLAEDRWHTPCLTTGSTAHRPMTPASKGMPQEVCPMFRQAFGILIAICLSAAASAVEINAGDWKFSASGNVNVHYIGSICEEETTPSVVGGLACFGAAGE